MKHCGTRRLETERLILRKFEKEDACAMYQNWASDDEVTKYLMWPTHAGPEVSRNVIKDWINSYSDESYYQWAIVLKDGRNEPIGSISVVDRKEDVSAVHTGYCIGKAWWHKGITSEALSAVMDFLFETVDVNRIEARHDPRNPNSGKVMKKCGMKYEGTLRSSDWNNQGICDACYYSLLKSERKAAAETGRPLSGQSTKGDGKLQSQRRMVRELSEGSEKMMISRQILEALPEWFGIPEAREEYIRESAEQFCFAAFLEERPIGFLCLKETGRETAEIAVMGVLKEYHHQGVGRELFLAAKRCAAQKGYSFLQVKTVRMGLYEEYDITNRFYQSLGFKEFEVFPTLWGEANPCQIYIMGING